MSPFLSFKDIYAWEIEFFDVLCSRVPAFEQELPALKARPGALTAFAKFVRYLYTLSDAYKS